MKFYRIRVNGVEYALSVEKVSEGVYKVQLGDKELEVFVEEESFRIVEEKPITGKEVVAQLPGNVVKIIAKPGDNVKKGDVLMVVESMKMENEILSPRDGVVLDIKVREGQKVEAGQILAVIQ